jgi:hypothetical protein
MIKALAFADPEHSTYNGWISPDLKFNFDETMACFSNYMLEQSVSYPIQEEETSVATCVPPALAFRGQESNLSTQRPSLFSYSLLTTIFLTILYSATVLLAILGNVLVIIVMCCGFRSSFLDISIYLMNLSVFNLLMAIFCIPFTFINTILRKWVFSSFMCPFTNFIQMLSVNGCIFTLTALAINRFFAVAYPLKYNAIKTKRQKRVSLIIVWMASIGISSVQLFVYKCVKAASPSSPPHRSRNFPIESESGNESEQFSFDAAASSTSFNNESQSEFYICKEVWDETDGTRNARLTLMYTIWIFLQTYCIPVLILIVMYSRIISILKNRNSSSSFLQENTTTSLQMNEQYEQVKIKTRKVCDKNMIFFYYGGVFESSFWLNHFELKLKSQIRRITPIVCH